MGRCNQWLGRGVVVLALSLGAVRAGAAEEGPNRGRVSFSVNSDITNAYFFRGILNERDGFIWEPYADLGFNLYKGEGAISSVDLGFGTWFSFQTEKTLATGEGPTNLYEVDYYPSLSVEFAGGFSTGLSYVLYTSPNGAFSTVQQLDWSLGFDDSEYLGAFALHPSALFSFELENTSFGPDEGGYFQFGLTPGFDAGEPYTVSFTFPLVVGVSMYDYYETSHSNDHTFGFFSFGVASSFPLSFIPEDFGSWSTGISVTALVLSDTLEEVNEGDQIFPVAVWSLGFEY